MFNIPNKLILEECYKRTLQEYGEKTISLVSCDVYLDMFRDEMTEQSNEIHIIFTSDLKDITRYHCSDQPKPMIARKLIKN